MSLIGTIQQSAGALQVAQIGLQVVGNNIANANTPGYLRQTLEQASAVGTRQGALIKGMGVRAVGIVQSVDDALAERLFNAQASLSGSETLQRAYGQLEQITTDLNNTGLSHQFSLFNNALHELSTQPRDQTLRDQVILQGETLATNLRRIHAEVMEQRVSWNRELDPISSQINRLTERIARQNLDIATIEGGGLLRSDATGLRDQRLRDLEELSKLIDINVQEQESGAVAIFAGGDYLVSNGNWRQVHAARLPTGEGNEIRIVETNSPVQASRGILASTMVARDQVFGDYLNRLDSIAQSLIRTMNEVHSQGQGRRGFRELVSATQVHAGVPLAEAGLDWVPRNGAFDMQVVDHEGELVSNHRIEVSMLGQVTDSTVDLIVAQIDAIDGVTASLTSDGRIGISADSPSVAFTFGEDTSGFLAAAGINTFFVGRGAFDIGVNETVRRNSDLLAISSGGIGRDTGILSRLVDLVDQPLESLDGRSLQEAHQALVANLGQRIGLQQSEAEGLRNFYATLQSQHLAITGVNIDEESIRMISYQRAFQASSRVIATAAEMLELLVQL